MNIDRARFLLCAGAIAGSGCVINGSDGDTDTTATTAPSTTNTTTTTSTTASETGDSLTGSTSVEGSESGSESGLGSGSTGTGSGSGSTGSASSETGTSGGVCDDSVGADVDCAPAVASDCGQFAVDACNGAKASFKPAVGEAAAMCIVGLGPADACDAAYACINDAMAGACADETANATCDMIIASCEAGGNPTTAEECHGFLDGMNEAGRAEMVACTVDDGCTFGIYSCTEGIGI